MSTPRDLSSVGFAFSLLVGLVSTLAVAGENDRQTIVAFRLTNWTSVNIDDAAKARNFADNLKTIGCEVELKTDNGQTDVRYRMEDWSPVEVADHKGAQQWIKWLSNNGFETLYGRSVEKFLEDPDVNKTGTEERILVTYRLTEWNSRHAHQPNSEKVMTTVFGALGCEIEIGKHGDHADVKFRCPEWMTAEFPSHKIAHSWVDFLKQMGFETRHEH